MHAQVVVLAGPSGSGKSRLAEHAGLPVLRLDDFYKSAGDPGLPYITEGPNAGIVEADEMDYRRCLAVQRPYLGPVRGYYTDWTPLTDRPGLFPEDLDESDPWQFKNVLVR